MPRDAPVASSMQLGLQPDPGSSVKSSKDSSPSGPRHVEVRISELRNDEAWRDEHLRRTWRTLWSQTSGATQFQTWEWQYYYWQHVTKRARAFLLTVGEPEPFVLGVFSRFRDKLSGLMKVAFTGEDRADYHMLLVRSGTPESVGVQALGELVNRLANRVSFVNFGNVPKCSWTGRVLTLLLQKQGTGLYRLTTSETFAVSLPKTSDEYLERLGERTRRAFDYDQRRLRRDHHVEFEVYANADERCLAAIESIDKGRWGNASGFWRRDQREFERSVAQALSKLGIFLAAVLYVDGRPAAFVHGAVVDSKWGIPKMGYDRGIPGKLSVGKVANFCAIQYAIEQGFQVYDLTRGGESYKKWLGATAHTNLHLRIYRTPVDRWLDRTMARVLTSIRYNPLLLRTYLKLRKETTGD